MSHFELWLRFAFESLEGKFLGDDLVIIMVIMMMDSSYVAQSFLYSGN